jgi:hypothetical protein
MFNVGYIKILGAVDIPPHFSAGGISNDQPEPSLDRGTVGTAAVGLERQGRVYVSPTGVNDYVCRQTRNGGKSIAGGVLARGIKDGICRRNGTYRNDTGGTYGPDRSNSPGIPGKSGGPDSGIP